MNEKRKLMFLRMLSGLGLFFFAGAASAQVTGELVEPDVMLVIDSSASMDWADNVPVDWKKSRTEWSIESCRRINQNQEGYGKTSWQKLITAFLGGVNTDLLKCVNEPPVVRPSLHAYAENEDLLNGFLEDEDFNGVPDNIAEFRKVSWSHFRLISCETQNWNQNTAGFYQCFDKSDPEEYNSNGFGDGFYCLYEDEKLVDGITSCKNINPKAGPRFANGIIGRYENLARFGIMTYDNVPSCLSESCTDHDKLWDYGYCRNWICEGDPEEGGDIAAHTCPGWNAGARNENPKAIGGMVRIQHNVSPSEQNERVRKVLETMEPIFCSPLAALLDDAGYYYATDQSVLPAGVDPNSAYHGSDKYYRCRRKVAVLIGDGQPTPAFEFAAGSCGNTAIYDGDVGNPEPYNWLPQPQSIDPDPEDFACDIDVLGEPVVDCPWLSTPEEASEVFQVGEKLLDEMQISTTDDDLPIFLVVIGYNVPEVNCATHPEKCIPYTQSYYENRRCWEGLPPCPPDAETDAGAACSFDCILATECSAAGGTVHSDMSCDGTDVCCEIPSYTCTYDCVSSSECTAQGGTLITYQTCPSGKVCCNIPVYTCTHDCMPFGICSSIGGTLISGETCPSGEQCCDAPDLKYGFSVQNSINLGSNNYMDSFDSEDGPYSLSNRSSTATVTTNSIASGAITLNNAVIQGDAYVGVGGNPATGIVELGTGSVTGTKQALLENVTIPAVSSPAGMPVSEGPISSSGGTVTWSSDRHFSSVTFTGVNVTVNGFVRVLCDGYFTMNGGSILIPSGSSLILYIGGNFTLDNGAKLNIASAEPHSLVTVMWGSGEWQVKNNSEIYTIGVQPGGGLTVESADYYGVYLGNHITGVANTNAGFHTDLSSLDQEPSGGTDSDTDTDTDTDTSEGSAEDVVCRMTPRQFMNEVACQGWPYQPEVIYNGIKTDKKPPWINPPATEDEQFCEPEGYTGDSDVYICRNNERAMFVNDPMKLQQAVDLILGSLSPPTWATRTDLVTWNVQLSEFYEETATQYEFRTGYVVPYGKAWKGVLTRYDWSCQYQNDAPTSTLRNVPELLATQAENMETNRNIYSIKLKDDGMLSSSDYLVSDPTATNITSWIDQVGTSNFYEIKELIANGPKPPGANDYNDCDFFGPNDTINTLGCEIKGDVRDAASKNALARGLADIYNSTPDILEPPRGNADIRSYAGYRDAEANRQRHPYLFVGTNDGVLHAFDVDEMAKSAAEATVERFGYIPRSVLGQIKDQYPISIVESADGYIVSEDTETGLFQHKWLLDGSPIARDMLLARSVSDPGAEKAEHWRAIVLGGLGKGGRGYYALDVTKSVEDGSSTPAPELLWEISRDARLYGNNPVDGAAKAAIEKMEFPLSKPALAYVPQKIGEASFHVAAAILPGGYSSDPEVTTGVYIVRMGDGKLLKYFEPGEPGDAQKGMCSDLNSEDQRYVAGLTYGPNGPRESTQLVGEPLVLQGSRYGSLASEALISDDRGRIWIIENLDEEDSSKWCMKLYFDTLVAWHFPYQNCIDVSCIPNSDCFHDDCCNQADPPSECAPAESTRNMDSPRVMILGGISVARDDKNNPVLIFGTGQYDGLSLWNRNRIFSITDVLEKDDNNNSFHVPKINWWIGDLGVTKDDLDFPIAETAYDQEIGEGSNILWLTDIHNEMSKTHLNPSMNSDTCLAAGGEASVKPAYFFNVGEKLIGRPTVFNEFAYFTTFVPIEDPANYQDACEAGTSRIWGIKYNVKLCETHGDCKQTEDYTLDSEYLTSAFDSIIGGFGCDEGMASEWKLFEEYPGSLLSSVQVVRRPDCVGRGDVFELAFQMKNPDASVSSQGTPPPDAVKTSNVALARGGGVDVVVLRFDSWSLVFE